MRKEYFCNLCNFKTNLKENFRNHNLTNKHKNNVYESKPYKCDICYYSTSFQQNYQKHLETQKHKTKADEKQKDKKQSHEIIAKNEIIYKTNNENEIIKILVEKCIKSEETIKELNENLKTVYEDRIQELKESVKYNNTINNTMNNVTNNNHFNLNFFLNETCKNAMNINEFVDSIVIEIKDLKYLAYKGYVEGISAIIIEQLNKLDIDKRPMHCSDIKRENIYIRKNNHWEKESINKEKTNELIRDVQRANTRALQDIYQKTFPHCLSDFKSKEHIEYGEIAYQIFGGKGDCDELNKKIIRKIVKEIHIDKNMMCYKIEAK